jgi:hypothetical protein
VTLSIIRSASLLTVPRTCSYLSKIDVMANVGMDGAFYLRQQRISMWTFLPGNLMADYYSIITNRGKELEAEALASGRLIALTHFVVGDSNGKQVRPDPAQVRLINETYRGDIADLVVSPEQSTQLMAKTFC